MFSGSSIIDFALGMIFFYFLLSTVCSTVNELIASTFDWRAEELQKGIRDLLDLPLGEGQVQPVVDQPAPAPALAGGEGQVQPVVDQPTPARALVGVAGLSPDAQKRRATNPKPNPLTLGDFLLDHSLIKGLRTETYRLRKLLLRREQHQPSYIPDRTFSLAIMDILLNLTSQYDRPISAANFKEAEAYLQQVQNNVKLLHPDLQHVLSPIIGAANDVDDARRNLESWFNAKMDRVKGSYKRWTQFVLLILAIIVSTALNADSITIGRALWVSPTLRQAIVAQADQRLAAGEAPPPADNQFQQVQRSVQDTLIFPIGWSDWCISTPPPTGEASNLPNCIPVDLSGWLQKVAGLLLTALAVSLGAPFWFDLLGKVSKLRSSGPAPEDKDSATQS